MIAAERETIVNYSDADEAVMIFTCIRPDISALRKRAGVTLVAEGTYRDGSPWARFEIPRESFDLCRAVKPELSEAQRKQRSEAAKRTGGRTLLKGKSKAVGSKAIAGGSLPEGADAAAGAGVLA